MTIDGAAQITTRPANPHASPANRFHRHQEVTVRVLEIVVGPNCAGCETARRLAADLTRRNLPGLGIRVLDLNEPDIVRPDGVFAVPTYLLDGRIISLGNPELDWLLSRVSPPEPDAKRSE